MSIALLSWEGLGPSCVLQDANPGENVYLYSGHLLRVRMCVCTLVTSCLSLLCPDLDINPPFLSSLLDSGLSPWKSVSTLCMRGCARNL